MTSVAKFPVLAALALLSAIGPRPIEAQRAVDLPAVRPDDAVAETLHARAMTLVMDTRRQAAAAALLVQAASLRSADDPRSVKDLLVAGKLYAYANDDRNSRLTLERAATRALEFGQILTAAHAYIDAAFVAIRQGDINAVRALTASAERVAQAPVIEASQRSDIIARINPARLAIGSR